MVRGIGDDCAILRLSSGFQLLVTTDLCLENVHFRREWHPSAAVGHRCLTRGLSDIAAMGGEPLACFLSLGLPKELPQTWVDGFLRGLLRLAHRFKVPLAGGDISAARQITADIVVTGQVPAGKAVASLRRPSRRPDLCHRITWRPGHCPEAALRRKEGQAGKVESSFLSNAAPCTSEPG